MTSDRQGPEVTSALNLARAFANTGQRHSDIRRLVDITVEGRDGACFVQICANENSAAVASSKVPAVNANLGPWIDIAALHLSSTRSTVPTQPATQPTTHTNQATLHKQPRDQLKQANRQGKQARKRTPPSRVLRLGRLLGQLPQQVLGPVLCRRA